jgi:hypothetical protein
VLQLDNEVVFNEAIIEERELAIQEIQQQIGEVHEAFKDLATLVHAQGVIIGMFYLTFCAVMVFGFLANAHIFGCRGSRHQHRKFCRSDQRSEDRNWQSVQDSEIKLILGMSYLYYLLNYHWSAYLFTIPNHFMCSNA